MHHISLVQNQSEMAHYGYADARALFADLRYDVTLYTAQNVSALSRELRRQLTDGLVLGSNALNDKTIRAYFEAQETANAIAEFLSLGGGLLSFHQLRIASIEGAKLSFLPGSLGKIRPVARATEESSASGELTVPGGAEMHTCMLYPNRLHPARISEKALGFGSLGGLYWHFWKDPDLSDWDVLLADDADHDASRPLVIASKETAAHRIVLSSLTLDWQQQREALQNILAYVVEGRHNTAVLSQSRNESQALAYLTAALEARRFPFQRYPLSEGLSSFEAHIESGVHTTVVLADDVPLEVLVRNTSFNLEEVMLSGALKILSIEPGDDPSRLSGVSVISHQTEAHRHLALVGLAVQAELRTGNIDGSFWSTAETLQVLTDLPEVSTDFGPLVERALDLAAEHDRDGSYDEVFGVTCALYWMRATYRGTQDRSTAMTEQWIRQRLGRFDTRERVLAYRTFAMVGTLTTSDRESLKALLDALPHNELSEIDLIAYIKAGVAAEISEPLPSLVDQLLGALQRNWVDLATTASAAAALLDARAVMGSSRNLRSQVKRDLDDTVRRAVVSLQEAMRNRGEDGAAAYPWEGKASTTVRCLEAWAKFDTQVAPPVYDVIDQLMGWDRVSAEIASTRTSLAVLDELKDENVRLACSVSELEPQVRDAIADLRLRRILIAALIFGVYCIAALVVAAGSVKSPGAGELLRQAFVKPLPFHLAVATLAVGAAVVPWDRLGFRKHA